MGYMRKTVRYSILQKLYGFHKWHIVPVEGRPYGMEVIKLCNRILVKDKDAKRGVIIEVGCGLGDILNKINTLKENKIGYDIDEKVIKGARIAHPGIRFQVGEFAPDIRGEHISVLIAVNFLYSLEGKIVEKEFQKLVINNDIKYIITETMYPATPNYPHSHDMDKILGENYTCIRKRGFAAAENSRRFILLYAKNKYING